MNRPLKEAAVTDPKWARKEQRREWLLKAVTAGVLIALTVGVLTIFQNRGQDRQITKITRTVETPCQTAPAGQECAAIRRAVALREPRANPCVSYQRVTGEKGKNCDRFYVKRSGSRGPGFNSGTTGGSQTSTGGGGTVPTGGDQDGSVQDGVGGGGNGSKPKGDAPATDSPSPPNAPSVPDQSSGESPGNSEGSGNSESSKANPVAEGVGSVVEGVGETVQETGKNVNEASKELVEGVTGKPCGLVGVDC